MAYKKIMSFSLWGSGAIYNVGAIRNAEIAKVIFPGWVCRFHVNNVPQQTIKKLSCFDNVEIVDIKSTIWKDYGRRAGGSQPEDSMFWKFYPYFDKDVEVIIGRDPDSRPSFREKFAIDEWLKSDKQFHIMRDHPGHCTGTPILGAMWGMKTSIGIDLKKLIDDYKESVEPLIDQWFLMKSIYPLVKNQSMIHHAACCANGCQVPISDPLYWSDGDNSEHRMFIPRKGTEEIGIDYLEIIGIDVDEFDIPSAENQGKFKKWMDGGIYWWKR